MKTVSTENFTADQLEIFYRGRIYEQELQLAHLKSNVVCLRRRIQFMRMLKNKAVELRRKRYVPPEKKST